ncbi:MAG: hypothetical protein ACLQVD_05190 [Capsulimonadaceae bacterium]
MINLTTSWERFIPRTLPGADGGPTPFALNFSPPNGITNSMAVNVGFIQVEKNATRPHPLVTRITSPVTVPLVSSTGAPAITAAT